MNSSPSSTRNESAPLQSLAMSRRPLAIAGLFCMAAIAACGSGTGSGGRASNARQILLTAAQLTQTQSFRMDGTITEDLSGSSALGSAAGPTGLNLHFD